MEDSILGDSNDYWLDATSDFDKISDEKFLIEVKYKKGNIEQSLLDFSTYYFEASKILIEKINGNLYDHSLTDNWSLAVIYLMRQSLELKLKGVIKKRYNNSDCQIIFNTHKHNLLALFNEIKLIYPNSVENEIKWLTKFLKDIEKHDSESSLFRYPFDTTFMNEYKNKKLNIQNAFNAFEITNDIIQAFCINNNFSNNDRINKIQPILLLLNGGFYDCYIWTYGNNSYYNQIDGFLESAKYLMEVVKLTKINTYFFPMCFLFRHSIELLLKDMIFMGTETHLPKKTIFNIQNSHEIGKKLWKNFVEVIRKYSIQDGQDLTQLDLAEKYLKKIDEFDKKGDTFRYPIDKSLGYHFYIKKKLDMKNVYKWFMEITSFLNGVQAWLDHIIEIENEVRSFYNDFN